MFLVFLKTIFILKLLHDVWTPIFKKKDSTCAVIQFFLKLEFQSKYYNQSNRHCKGICKGAWIWIKLKSVY